MPVRMHSSSLYRPVLVAVSLLSLATRGLAAAGGGVATPDSWPMFRGNPSLTGVAPTALPDAPRLLWTAKTGGPVRSSPAIDHGRVYCGSADGRLYALDFQTGSTVWATALGDNVESSPLVLGQRVFVGSEDGHLYALDAATGRVLWKYATDDKILGGPNWVAAPNGGEPWILAGSYDFRLHCVDAGTGRSNWVYETGNYINGTPAVSEGRTVFGGCDALLHVLTLANGQKEAEIDAGAYIAGSAALIDGRAYLGHYENEFFCIDLRERRKVWTYKDRRFPYFSSPAVTRDQVVFGGRDKRLHCVRRDTGELQWAFATGGKVDSSPVVAGTRVVVGSDDGRVYLLSLADGREVWSQDLGQPIGTSPAVAAGRFVVGSEDGNLYAFGSAPKP